MGSGRSSIKPLDSSTSKREMNLNPVVWTHLYSRNSDPSYHQLTAANTETVSAHGPRKHCCEELQGTAGAYPHLPLEANPCNVLAFQTPYLIRVKHGCSTGHGLHFDWFRTRRTVGS